MKEITVISGKGGTGKTTITASFAALAEEPMMADCDVDASNLPLLLEPQNMEEEIFEGSKIAVKEEGCIDCGRCEEVCRFDAITDEYEIDELKCEGCGACVYVCPVDVLSLKTVETGKVYSSKTRFGRMIHASLNAGEEASGKLVTKVKQLAKQAAKEDGNDLIIIDGSPGIGCPVIASISGSDIVLIVTEPTLSGIHDMERVYEMTKHFEIPSYVCINKYDINEKNTEVIEEFCRDNDIPVLGRLPYDKSAIDSMIHKKTVVEYSDSPLSRSIKELWEEILKEIEEV